MAQENQINRAIIKLHFEEHKTYDQICSILRVGRSRVSECIKYYKDHQKIKPSSKRGRPTVKTPALLTYIMSQTLINRRISCLQIAEHYSAEFSEISRASICRFRNELKLRYRPPKLRPHLNENQIGERYKFAQNLLRQNIDYRTFVFSDESKMMFTSDNRYIWYIPGENDDSVFDDQDKVKPWIMIWGAIGYNYKSPLIICPKSVTATQYKEVIKESKMIETLNSQRGEGNWVFQQDGATPHTAKSTRNFLHKRMAYIEQWPANSPDLNPIEHLWAILKYRILEEEPETFKDMLRIMKEEWDSLSMELINKLVLSFRKRLLLVSEHKGHAIGQYIKSYDEESIVFIPDETVEMKQYIAPMNPNIPEVNIGRNDSFTLEEDLLLLRKYSELGPKWTKMTEFFTDRTANQLRNRYKHFRGKEDAEEKQRRKTTNEDGEIFSDDFIQSSNLQSSEFSDDLTGAE